MGFNNDPNDWYEYEGDLFDISSQKSVKFQGDTWDEASFVPRSQIIEQENVGHMRCRLRISGWLCRKNGWS